MNILPGKKTYILVATIVLYAAYSFLHGDVTLAQAVNNGLDGLGLATLRIGIASLSN